MKLINLTPIEHDFGGRNVKFLSDFSQNILSFDYQIFKIFCMNGLSHKWSKLIYKVGNFDSYWAWFCSLKVQNLFKGPKNNVSKFCLTGF